MNFTFLPHTHFSFKIEEGFNVLDVIKNSPNIKLLDSIIGEPNYAKPIAKLPRGKLLKVVVDQIGDAQSYKDCMTHIKQSCATPILPNLEGLTALLHYGKDKLPSDGFVLFGFDEEKHLFGTKVPVLAQSHGSPNQYLLDCSTRTQYGAKGNLKTYLAYYTALA